MFIKENISFQNLRDVGKTIISLIAAWLAQLGERRSAEREVAGRVQTAAGPALRVFK